MKKTISELLTQYEDRTLSRRALISALTMVAAAGATTSAAGPRAITLDHVSLQVSDLERSRDFYRNVFGLSVNTNPRPDDEVRLDLGENGFVVLRRFSPAGRLDHLALKLEGFNKTSVTQQLRGLGIAPIDEPNTSPTRGGFHVVDPDGLKIQLV